MKRKRSLIAGACIFGLFLVACTSQQTTPDQNLIITNPAYELLGEISPTPSFTPTPTPTVTPTPAGPGEEDYLEMPIISIYTDNCANITSKEKYLAGSLSIMNCEEEYLLEAEEMKIRGRGNYSWKLAEKKSYKLKLTDEINLLGVGSLSKTWCLLANHCDQSLLRNYIVSKLCQELSGIAWSPDCINVELYLNGEYQGVYLLIEDVKVAEDKINIDDDVESDVNTGYLLQMTYNSDEAYHFEVDGYNYDIKSDLSSDAELAAEQLEYIKFLVEACWNAVECGDVDFILEYMDIDSIIDTYLIEEFTKNLDVGYDSFFMYKDRDGKLTFGPVWDFDISLGNSNEHGCQNPEKMYASDDCCINHHSNNWFVKLMEQDWFVELVVERWQQEEIQELFRYASLLVKETAEDNYEAFCHNFDRWPIFGERQNLEPLQVLLLHSYREHYEHLCDWMDERFEWLNEKSPLKFIQQEK